MHLERISLTNFRCFGSSPQTIELGPKLTTFIGSNGSGKTAVMLALLRMFGVTSDQRRMKRQDFHVPADEKTPPAERTLSIEAIFRFPELDSTSTNADTGAVPEFFNQMAADSNGNIRCRLRLDATWTEDGSAEGNVETHLRAIRTLDTTFGEADCAEVPIADRSRIQMIYIPASRDAASQVNSFLRGRLWRAVTWSESIRKALSDAGVYLNTIFQQEEASTSFYSLSENAGRRCTQPQQTPIHLSDPLMRDLNSSSGRLMSSSNLTKPDGSVPRTVEI